MNGPHVVTSLDDPRVEVFRDVRDRDLRGRSGIFMAESELVVRRLLRTPEQLHSLLLAPTRLESMAEQLECLPDDVPVYVAGLEVMGAVAGFHIHRGVLAAGWRPSEQDLVLERLLERTPVDGRCMILAAQGINNSDNMGGLFRTAAALGVAGILLGDHCCDPLYRKAIRVSMGHVLAVPWAVHDSMPEALQRLGRERGMTIIAAESCSGSRPLAELDIPERSVIVVGAEGAGLEPDVLAVADHVVEIPMAPGVPSLNVVVAAGVMLWHARG